MPNIYLATLKNFISENQFNKEKYNFLVIKEHNYKLKKLLRNQQPVSVDLIANYDPSDKYLLSFKVDDHQSVGFKAYIYSKFEEFTKENNNINKESINNFFKFLEADGLYHFEALSPNEKLNELSAPIKLPEIPNKEILASSQNFLDAERNSNRVSRSNLLSEAKIDAESLRRANSFAGLAVENSNSTESIESLTASQDSTESESLKLNNDQLVREIQSVFFKGNQTLLNINKHASSIQNGRFNGFEKSTYLEKISRSAETIDFESSDFLNNSQSVVNVVALKNKIDELKSYINDKKTIDVLSRYRGFSPLRCFATLWGGGKVKSIEYVEQLQEQLGTLTKNISETRPTV